MTLPTLSGKLTTLLGVVTATALLLGGVAYLAMDYFAIRRAIVSELRAQIQVVGPPAGLYMVMDDLEGVRTQLSYLKGSEKIFRAALYTNQGKVYAQFPNSALPSEFPPLPSSTAPTTRFEGELVEIFTPNDAGDGAPSYLYVQGRMDALWPRVQTTLKVQALVFVAVFGLVFLLSLRLQRSLSQPLLRLANTVQAVGEQQDYSLRVQPEGGSVEIFRLGEGFNAMINAVQERDLQLLHHQEDLEGEVSARTEELTHLNRELLTAKNRAEDASRAKSAFLANMSHELRTPLNAVLLYSELLRGDAEERGLHDLAPDIQTIHGAGKHLLRLIDGILDLSSIEAGQINVFTDPVELGKLVASVTESLVPLMKAHENEMSVALADDIPPLQTDRKKLQTILFNLLENAGKFTRKGTVRVEARLEGDRVRLDVRDTGMGMNPEQVERIFQGFTQVDESSTRRIGGIGLGLTLSQKLAQMLEGTIEVQSQLGKGTCFTLWLPLVAHRRSNAMTFTPAFDPALSLGLVPVPEKVSPAWSFMPGTEKP